MQKNLKRFWAIAGSSKIKDTLYHLSKERAMVPSGWPSK